MSERDALIERVKRQAKLPYNRLCSEVRFIGGPIMETGCGPYHMEKGLCQEERQPSHTGARSNGSTFPHYFTDFDFIFHDEI